VPKAMSARRRSLLGRRPCFSWGEGVEKREKASRISDSVEGGMECSFARADWRGLVVGALEVEAPGAWRLGGCWALVSVVVDGEMGREDGRREAYHCYHWVECHPSAEGSRNK